MVNQEEIPTGVSQVRGRSGKRSKWKFGWREQWEPAGSCMPVLSSDHHQLHPQLCTP